MDHILERIWLWHETPQWERKQGSIRFKQKLHCIYEVHFSQAQSNLPEIIQEASLKDP